MKSYQRVSVAFAFWVGVLCSSAAAITINLEYTSNPLFSVTYDGVAKAAINQAAADISVAITTSLNAINNDVWVGMNGAQTTATFDWYYQLTNPSGAGSLTVDPATIAAYTVTLKVGAKSILGTTLGIGGPAGAGFSLNGSGFPSQWVGAVANGESLSQTAYRRGGGGPKMGTLAGSATLGGTTANYSIDVAMAYGSLSLDRDSNDDGINDSDAQLNNYWHFNHNTPVASGKNDLYSVALHEMIHALGIGTSDSWEAKNPVGTANWTGANVIALTGSGTNLLNPSADHIAEGIMSTNAYNGSAQEAVMDPSIYTGERKYLTALDLAFLRDIGYTTINWVTPSFSPADFDNDGDVDGADLLTWRNSYDMGSNGDADNDGDTDGRDFLVWQREYTGAMLTAAVAVPEPASGLLFLISLALLGRRRGSR